MLKQHMELTMFVCPTMKTTRKPELGRQRKLSFIEKDVRNYIIREVWNIFEQNDAKEFGKYNLVFCSFVGVNHRGQLTLLGCALIKNENIQSFK
ncbi:hypothetical protein Ahy_B01g056641 isoform A [Arachis hypogaea]|uniref:Protein FAR1-RELATED SEQUENCE n=1 Tax=Arachis hypogaea TaxID=3818 RepID=A0A445AZA9_ARAHY|nr:hypothetical protein Ahy_B01g056641 isoform A [Arachis hypogaea]